MRMDPFSTHQALVVAAMAQTSGDIVEMGGGWYSTPLVSAFSAARPDRQSCTIETGTYVFNILTRLETPNHTIKLMDGFDFDTVGKFKAAPEIPKSHYLQLQAAYLEAWWKERTLTRGSGRLSVVLVDHAPGFLRVPAIEFFSDKTDYIITHDTEHVVHYGLEPTLSSFTHRWDFTLHKPNAVIVSNYLDCSRFGFLAGSKDRTRGG